jgi:hypothetical protein
MTLWQRNLRDVTNIALLACALTVASRAEASGFVESIDDPGLNYFALGLLIFVVVLVFYGLIAIHDIPARIAESRHHPHADAIHAAGWVSLFTLHVLWPFLWIWAMAYKPERGWGFSTTGAEPSAADEIKELQRRLAEIEAELTIKPEKPQSSIETLKIMPKDKE